jgi:outer membrane receptor protein involved in Fe transport
MIPHIYQWNGERSTRPGETDDMLFNLSDGKNRELRSKFNLKYLLPGHHFNLNNQAAIAESRPKDDYLIDFLGYDPSGFPSNMNNNVTGLAYEYRSNDSRWQNTASLKMYYLRSKIYRTEEIGITGEDFKQMPSMTSNRDFYWGYLDGISFEAFKNFRVKASYEHAVRLPDVEELFGNGISIKSAVNLKPEQSDNFNVGVIFDRGDFAHLTRVQLEANAFYMLTTNLISLGAADFNRSAYQNIDNTLIKGSDADLKIDFLPALYGYFNITWQDSAQ